MAPLTLCRSPARAPPVPYDPRMEPSTLAARLASSAVAPLVKKLFVAEGPGAGLVDGPVRISSGSPSRGEQRTLTERELRKLAEELVARSRTRRGAARGARAATRAELADALATALHSLGDLDMDDVQAVRLGPEGLAARLTPPRPSCPSRRRGALSGRCCTPPACTSCTSSPSARPSSPAPSPSRARQLDQLITVDDLIAARLPSRTAEDARFERAVRRAHRPQARRADHLRPGPATAGRVAARRRLHLAWRPSAGAPAPAAPVRSPPTGPWPGTSACCCAGCAGSGKTTLIQWLAVAAARQEYAEQPRTAHRPRPLRAARCARMVREGLPPLPTAFCTPSAAPWPDPSPRLGGPRARPRGAGCC